MFNFGCTPMYKDVRNHICAHVKDPAVYVRVQWNMETFKHSACTVGWVSRLCRSQLSHGRNPMGQCSCNFFLIAALCRHFVYLRQACMMRNVERAKVPLRFRSLVLQCPQATLVHESRPLECSVQVSGLLCVPLDEGAKFNEQTAQKRTTQSQIGLNETWFEEVFNSRRTATSIISLAIYEQQWLLKSK